MARINRTLLLKRVAQYPSDRLPLIDLQLHTLMDRAFTACNSVWDRHYPAKEKVVAGRHCVFFRRVNRQGTAVLFHAYAYVAGHTPDQVVLEDIEEQLSAEPIRALDGSRREIVERFAVVVIGEVLILESARFNAGGQLVVRAMRDLIKRHTDIRCPTLNLEDAPTLDFQRMARINGGVASITARLHRGFVTEPNTFGRSLETVVEDRGFPNAKLTATIEAIDDDVLDPEQVEAMLNESEDGTGLSAITIKFKSGASLNDLKNYREKSHISVEEARPGIPSVTAIETEIVQYLFQLATPTADNFQLITVNGIFT